MCLINPYHPFVLLHVVCGNGDKPGILTYMHCIEATLGYNDLDLCDIIHAAHYAELEGVYSLSLQLTHVHPHTHAHIRTHTHRR